MNIHTKLAAIQSALNAPKNQRNSFGGYNYRSCEDILEAVKPLLADQGLTLTISDRVEERGGRFYVVATATVHDITEDAVVAVEGWAREVESKKGMDSAQITGAASSYGRKYALNGLFAIDDAKDADTDEHRNQVDNAPAEKPKTQPKDDGKPPWNEEAEAQAKVDAAREGVVKVLKAKKVAPADVKSYCQDQLKVNGLSEITTLDDLEQLKAWAELYGA